MEGHILNTVIYCRVASRIAADKENSIAAQQAGCETFAKSQGYRVLKTFAEFSCGNCSERPEFEELLSFLRTQPRGSCAVVFSSADRLARRADVYLELRDEIREAGGIEQSPRAIETPEDRVSVLYKQFCADMKDRLPVSDERRSAFRRLWDRVFGKAVMT